MASHPAPLQVHALTCAHESHMRSDRAGCTHRPQPPSGSCTDHRYRVISSLYPAGRGMRATWHTIRRPVWQKGSLPQQAEPAPILLRTPRDDASCSRGLPPTRQPGRLLLLAPSGTVGTGPRCGSNSTRGTPHMGRAEPSQPLQGPTMCHACWGTPRWGNVYLLICFCFVSCLLACVTLQMGEVGKSKHYPQKSPPSLPGPPEHGAHSCPATPIPASAPSATSVHEVL